MSLNTHLPKILIILFSILFSACEESYSQKLRLVEYQAIKTGAEQTENYFHLLRGKKIAVVTNHTGIIGRQHIVDTLLSSGIQVVKIFTPEHGFRGDQDAGAHISNLKDEKTGLPVVSLYGNKKKPEVADLKDVDVILFDLQDVGVRFYTYISTLTYVMDACAENKIPIIVLDRPNPNGFYIDGPVLASKFKSFVGLHPVPVVYGLTIGEYALMVNGENWLESKLKADLLVIPLIGYEREMIVKLPMKPSPNLPDWESIYLYPSLCFFEGTIVSVGRGTQHPFKVFGHPDLKSGSYKFTPIPIKGASSKPKLEGQVCNGFILNDYANDFERNPKKLNLSWLIDAWKELNSQHPFFNNYFNTLAGTDNLRKQIEQGLEGKQIEESWINEIESYKKIRINYLIYPDFK
ncbi:MAG: DUF1343 domain-containing protein [Bacteroidales bacterium]|nr:DUF1343 domain-containing protein [Bacteroidales bacterium]